MAGFKRLINILRFGIGPKALERKRAAKAARREAVFESGLWSEEDSLARRRYASYDEYVSHQQAKLDNIAHRLEETLDDDYAEFYRRFESCEALPENSRVLCLGARLGTEVRAFIDLGHLGVGIDLNPGADNPYVMYGDFHNLQFADGTFDAAYCNALDHVFELERVVLEVRRILRPGGLFIVDALPGFEEGFTPGKYEATHWRRLDDLVAGIENAATLRLASKRDLGTHRRDQWIQLVFEAASEAAPRAQEESVGAQ